MKAHVDAGLSQAARRRPGSSRPLRVLHCLWSGGIGGSERAVYQLARGQIQQAEVEPGLLFAHGDGHYWKEAQMLGCPVVDLELRHGHALASIHRVADAMRGFDVHHFHSAEPLFMLASVLRTDATRVYTHRGGLIRYGLAKRVRHELTGRLLRRQFHGFSANTRHAARVGEALFRVPATAFEVIYNGVDFELLRPTREAAPVRAELGLSSKSFVLGTAATLKPEKRIDRLIDLSLRVSDPTMRVLVLGDGPDRARLQSLVEERGVASRVLFVGAKPNVGDYLQVMDAFCLPSIDSFGNAVVEAMGVGLPSIVFDDGGGMPEHIDDGQTGFVVSDEDALARTVRRLISDPPLRRRIGVKAMSEVRRRYTTASALTSYLEFYRRSAAANALTEDGGSA